MSVIRVKSAFTLRRDTAANWNAKNPILREGEEGYETDTGRRKVGNGTTEWNNLKYDSGIVDQTYTPDSENAQSGKAVAEAVSTEQKRSDNIFANALKAVKSGESLIIDDVSPVTHNMSVKVMSKNLIPFPYYNFPLSEIIVNGLTFITYEDGSILVNGTSEATTQRYLYRNTKDLLGLKTGDTIAFSWALSDNTTDINAYCNYFDSAAAIHSSGMALSKTITSSTGTITNDWIGFAIYIIFKAGVTYNNLLIKPQLELGTTATAYTPYVPDLTAVKVIKSNASGEAVAEYTPSADGTVKGVSSLYPNTTLMTDTDGVLIDCEYNKDINKFSGIDVYVPTKTSELINDSNFATQDYVDEEIANFDFIKIVTELPETGLVNRTYFVPKQDPVTNDLYDEYMWVDGTWELITTKQIEVDLTNYYTKAEVDNAIAGIGGGHWETVMDIVWDFNDYIHIVSYDPETHIFTCNSGELDWATVGERLTYAIAPVCDTNQCKTTELPFNNFRELAGDSVGGYIGGFVRLSDTEFTFKDIDGNIVPVPNETTMDISKFHFEHLTPRTITNLNCTKARYTLTDTIQAVSSYSYPPKFFNVSVNDISSGGYNYNWVYKSVISGVAEMINGYGVEKHDIIQNITYTGTYVKNEIQKITRITKQPLSNPIITDLKFAFDWGAGLSIPRNGGLFKLERWVE